MDEIQRTLFGIEVALSVLPVFIVLCTFFICDTINKNKK